MSQSNAQPAPSRIRTFLHIALLVFLTSMLCNTRPSKNPSFQLQRCGDNLHQIGVELERQRLSLGLETYPETLPERWGDIDLPACPVGGQDSYRSGYQRAEDGHSYLLVCAGSNHEAAEVPPDYPRIGFSSDESQRGMEPSEDTTPVESSETPNSQDGDEERSTEDSEQADETPLPASSNEAQKVSEEEQKQPADELTPAPTDS